MLGALLNELPEPLDALGKVLDFLLLLGVLGDLALLPSVSYPALNSPQAVRRALLAKSHRTTPL